MIRTKIHFKEDKKKHDIDAIREISFKGDDTDLVNDIRAIAYGLKEKAQKDCKSRVQYRNRITAIENAFNEGLRMTKDELHEIDGKYMQSVLDDILEEIADEEVDMEMLS